MSPVGVMIKVAIGDHILFAYLGRSYYSHHVQIITIKQMTNNKIPKYYNLSQHIYKARKSSMLSYSSTSTYQDYHG